MLQNNGAEVIADFAARVAKAATEESDTSATETAPSAQALQNTSLNQCNASPPMLNTQKNIAGAGAGNIVSTINNQSLDTNSMSQIDSGATKIESKALQLPAKEFQPRNEVKNVTIEESSPVVVPSVVSVANKDNVSVQFTVSSTTATTTTEPTSVASTANAAAESETVAAVSGTGNGPVPEAKSVNNTSAVLQTPPVAMYWTNLPQELPKPSVTSSTVSHPVPTKEPFPNLAAKTSSSPPRRKQNVTELPSSKDSKEQRKTREKSLGSRGATPTPDHHQKTNGDATSDKTEGEALPRNSDIQQKPSESEYAIIDICSITVFILLPLCNVERENISQLFDCII